MLFRSKWNSSFCQYTVCSKVKGMLVQQEVFLTVDVCALDGRVRRTPVLRITSAKCDRLKVRSFASETQASTVHSTFSNTLRRFSTTQRPLTDLPTEWPQELELPH